MSKKRADSELTVAVDDKTARGFKNVQSNMRNMASGAAALEGPLGQVAGRLNAIGAALGRMSAAQFAGIAGFAAITTGAIKALIAGAQFEKQMFRISKQIEITGHSAGVSAMEIEAYTRALGENTLASAVEARDAASSLLVYKNITGGLHEEILKLGQDMTAVLGGSLTSNVKKIARAFDNPRQGLETLSRTVLSLDDDMRKNIQTMFESGNVAGAQSLIFEQLRSKLGGAGQGEAAGLSGAVDTLGERWTNMLELIGDGRAGKNASVHINNLSSGIKFLNSLLRDDLGNAIYEEQDRHNQATLRFTNTLISLRSKQYDGDESERKALIEFYQAAQKSEDSTHQNKMNNLIDGRKALIEENETQRKKAAILADVRAKEEAYFAEEKKQSKYRLKAYKEFTDQLNKNKRKGDELYQASLTQEEKIIDLYVRRSIALENLSMEEVGGQERRNKIMLGLHREYLADLENLESSKRKPSSKDSDKFAAQLKSVMGNVDPQGALDSKFKDDSLLIAFGVDDEEKRYQALIELQRQYVEASDKLAKESAERQGAWNAEKWQKLNHGVVGALDNIAAYASTQSTLSTNRLRESADRDQQIIAERYENEKYAIESAKINGQITEEEYAQKKHNLDKNKYSSLLSLKKSTEKQMQTEGKKAFEYSKKLSIASAALSGIEAAVSSYAAGAKIGGPILGSAFAAASVLATTAMIQQIKSQSFNSSSGVSVPGHPLPQSPSDSSNGSLSGQGASAPLQPIIVQLSDKTVAEFVVLGNRVASANDMQVFETQDTQERVIIA